MEHEIFLYPYSKAEAGRRGELDRWEESFRANVSCAREIEAVIPMSMEYFSRGLPKAF